MTEESRVSLITGLPLPAPALARFVAALRGRGGAALVARIKAHPLAPAADGSQGGATRHQLAMILATARASKWRPAAEAVARAEGFLTEGADDV